MYYIMNGKLNKIIGTMSLNGGHTAMDWFMTDEIHEEIASEDSSQADDTSVSEVTRGNNKGWNSYVTLTIPKTSQYFTELTTTGNHLLHDFEGKTQCYRITDVTIESTGFKATITAYNLALFNLKHTTPEKKSFNGATSQMVFEYLFGKTGWIIKTNEYLGGENSLEIDGKTTANTLLQSALQTFDAEIRAYVEVEQGIVINKYVEIMDQRGDPNTGRRVEYGWNATEIQKTVTDGALITKLYVFGKDDLTLNSDKDFRTSYIVDDTANDLYNSSSDLYLEGVATNDEITNADALRSWGEKLLKYYNHPRANYTVTVDPTFEANVGDTIRVIDDTINLTLASRVIQKVVSESTPTSNQVVLGEFITVRNVTPAAIEELEDKMAKQLEMINAVNKAIADASSISIDVLTPDGQDFKKGEDSKRLIMHAREGETNIGAYIRNKGWRWRNLATNEEKHGYEIAVTNDSAGLGTWRAQIDNSYISSASELDVKTDTWKYVGKFYPREELGHVCQCVFDAGSFYYTSHALNNADDDTVYCQRDANFKILAKMTIKHGGHGTNFGVLSAGLGGNDTLVIQRHSADKKTYYASAIPWQDNATVSSGFSDIYTSSAYLTVSAWGDRVQVKEHDTVYIFDSNARNVQLKNALYSVNFRTVGLGKDDYYQSQATGYPYSFWCSGHTGKNAPNRVNAVNYINGGRCFREIIDFGTYTNNVYDGPNEIESANLDFQGENLLVSYINYDKAEKLACQFVYKYPLIKRSDADSDDDTDYTSLGGDEG